MTIIESATAWMEETANDPAHGYDQTFRWGQYGDYDCSSAVITAYSQAGLDLSGASYTGNIKEVFEAAGFVDVSGKVDFATGSGMERGDVLLNVVKHVAMYCGDGLEVEASINEKGTAKGGQPGDQTGKEFLIRPYRNYPWDYVLRYGDTAAPATPGSGGHGYTPGQDHDDIIKMLLKRKRILVKRRRALQ